MSPRNLIVSLVVSLVLGGIGFSQRIEIPDWENAVRFELVASQEPIRLGDSFELALVADIEPGYHLYGPEEQEPSRTEVAVRGENLEVGTPSFPPVIKRELEGLGTYDLYEGRVAIRIPVTLAESAEPGTQHAYLTVNYQVCTDFACSAPTSDDFSIQLDAAKPGTPVKALHPDVFKAKKKSSP